MPRYAPMLYADDATAADASMLLLRRHARYDIRHIQRCSAYD